MAIGDDPVRVGSDDLLLSIAEQLKVPLTTIARQAELGQLTGDLRMTDVGAIGTQAAAALTLVDSYLLGLQLWSEQVELVMEPVSVSSLLVDVAHELSRFAQYYGVELELRVGGRYGPVMSHQRGLKAALLSLGFSLVEAEASRPERRPRHVTLGFHRTPHGLVAGMYGEYEELRADRWRTALDLAGKARQPLTAIGTGSAAGLFVADAIFRSMNSRLRVGRYQHEQGLAATLQPSRQLQFV